MGATMRHTLTALMLLVVLHRALGRDDGLARTPPMGWSTWYAFGGDLNETKIVQMADMIVSTGLRDAGYRFVNLDDAWMSPIRDRFGKLQGDLTRFPSGIKWLADQMHSRGLLLGLYGCAGVRTCLGFPGQFEHEYADAATIAEWGVDFWKHDNCFHKWSTIDTYGPEMSNGSYPNSEQGIEDMLHAHEYGLNVRGLSVAGQDAHPIKWNNVSGLPLATPDIGGTFAANTTRHQIQLYEAYRLFGEALLATGRNITYSICPLISGCDPSVWNYYKAYSHMSMNQCPQRDNTDTWESFTWHVDDANSFPTRAEAAGPGYWHDMDMLMVGYKQLKAWQPRQTVQEYRSQMSLFSIFAAPLLFSADIRGTNPPTNSWNDELASVLLNKGVLAVNQDPLGKMGGLVKVLTDGVELYARPLEHGALAVALLNRGATNATDVLISWADVGVTAGKKVMAVKDLWGDADVPFTPAGCTVKLVVTHDTAMLRLTIV